MLLDLIRQSVDFMRQYLGDVGIDSNVTLYLESTSTEI
jgi:hypothetical protein